MNSEAPIINLQDVSFSYPGGKSVFNHLDFKFYSGDRIGLIAPNGSGKTTFFHLIMGLNRQQPTVIEDVAFGPANLGKSKNDALKIARRTLADLGLEGFEDRITFKLSGGEKRLVSLAAVLAMEPEVLLLDEPLNALDSDTSPKIAEIISNLGQSYIIISHDIDFSMYATNKICTINHGNIEFEDESHMHVHRHMHPHGRYPHKHK